MGRPKLYTDEELKERKKEYDIKYQTERYRTDKAFRDKKNQGNIIRNRKKVEHKREEDK
jgi:hypothetical protein